eukprot:4260223-Pleurochrysis_carterae.AAC.1
MSAPEMRPGAISCDVTCIDASLQFSPRFDDTILDENGGVAQTLSAGEIFIPSRATTRLGGSS